MFALKSHPFFEGIDWDNLSNINSPIPIPRVKRSSMKQTIINKYKYKISDREKVFMPQISDASDFTSAANIIEEMTSI